MLELHLLADVWVFNIARALCAISKQVMMSAYDDSSRIQPMLVAIALCKSLQD
jgi:hypothetical protein